MPTNIQFIIIVVYSKKHTLIVDLALLLNVSAIKRFQYMTFSTRYWNCITFKYPSNKYQISSHNVNDHYRQGFACLLSPAYRRSLCSTEINIKKINTQCYTKRVIIVTVSIFIIFSCKRWDLQCISVSTFFIVRGHRVHAN